MAARCSFGAFGCFGFWPAATALDAIRQGHVGMRERRHRRLDVGRRRAHLRVEIAAVDEVRDRHAEQMASAEVIGKPGVREDLRQAWSAAAAARHHDVVLQRADHARKAREREARRHPVLERLEEELLPGDAVDVGVGVPEADEVERLLAVELLVPRLEVDLGVAVRPADSVEVPVVDLHINPVQLVHEQLEAVEVDRDQVVDRQAGQLLHGLERPVGRALRARRPGRVDPVGLERGDGVAIDRHLKVARERQQRQRVVRRIRADQHDRVGARVGETESLAPGAGVVADDQRRRRLRRGRQRLQVLLGHLERLRVRRDRVERLVAVEIRTAGETDDDHDEREQEPAEYLRGRAASRAPRRLGRLVPPHRLEHRRRQDRATVAIHGRGATHSSLERRPHTEGGAHPSAGGSRYRRVRQGPPASEGPSQEVIPPPASSRLARTPVKASSVEAGSALRTVSVCRTTVTAPLPRATTSITRFALPAVRKPSTNR